MATFIKKKVEDNDGADAEDLVQEALESLSRDWTVFWQYRFENDQSRRTKFCEIDFIVWNKSFGIFVLEVKGGMWKFEGGHSLALRNNQWEVDYPFEQRPQLAVFFFVFFGFSGGASRFRPFSSA